MQEYELARIYLDREEGDFEGPKSEYLVSVAEEELGLRFPPSYRQFLLEYGCGDIRGTEIYGVIDNEFEDGGIPDAIWFTLELRKSVGLDEQYVVVAEQGDGSFYAIDTSEADEEGECPVVQLSVGGSRLETLHPSFGAFLLGVVQDEVGGAARADGGEEEEE